MGASDVENGSSDDTHRIAAESMPLHLPGADNAPSRSEWQDVVLQTFTHATRAEPILVPAVVEPLLVLVMTGAATVEERSLGGQWESVRIQKGDFFLISTPQPYEMRWETHGCDTFEVVHLYLGLPVIDRAARERFGAKGVPVTFKDISGARDEPVDFIVNQLLCESRQEREPSRLLVKSLAQALAVHLVRNYVDLDCPVRSSHALQAWKLRRVIDTMNERLAESFSLARLAGVAQLSDYHFSRVFKRATGLSPSQFFIRLRMNHARRLLRETERNVIDIGMEVGYSSASHFSQVFRREVGVAPSVYREG